MGALYGECCRAKVHFLYMAYRRRIERSICLHIAMVISIWGSLSPVGHFCSLLTTLEKADVSETLKVPVHLGGWTVIDLPKTASTPMRRTGSGFLTRTFFLSVVSSSDAWPGVPGLPALATGGLSKTIATCWKHLCTSRSEGDCGKKWESRKGCLDERVGVVCRSHRKFSSSGVHGEKSWYTDIDSQTTLPHNAH